jgi:DNA replication protein DnaC
MINSETDRKLREMNLSRMAKEYARQNGNITMDTIPFEDRFRMLVDEEYSGRKDAGIKRLIKKSGILLTDACPRNLYTGAERQLEYIAVQNLSTCNFIRENRNVIITGSTGSGKTWLASCIGVSACRQGIPVVYASLEDFCNDIAASEDDLKLRKNTFRHYTKCRLLIIDEFLRCPLSAENAGRLLRIIDYRYDHDAPVIFCSQYVWEKWFDKLGDKATAEALIDRIKNRAYIMKIVSSGKSMREITGGEPVEL